MSTCPCDPAREFSECCGPYLSGDAPPPTAEALMRSRYSAYVRGDFPYLLATWHSSNRQKVDFGAQEGIRWTGLEILNTAAGGPEDQEGTVEFIVSYTQSGTARTMHEKSRFVQEDDRWFYVDGIIMPQRSVKVGRNEPCPCGSGKKFKKCCQKAA